MRSRKTRKDKISFSSEDIRKVEKLAALGLNMDQIASIFSTSSDTLYRRCNEGNTDLSAAIQRGRALSIKKVSQKAFELALEGDVGLIKYILSCKGGWSEKSQITLQGGDRPISISASISDDQLKKMANEYLESKGENSE